MGIEMKAPWPKVSIVTKAELKSGEMRFGFRLNSRIAMRPLKFF